MRQSSRGRWGTMLVVLAVFVLAGLVLSRPARADDFRLSDERPAAYYLTHSAISASALLGAGLLHRELLDDPPRTGTWFGFDQPTEDNFSLTAASISDMLLIATVLVPPVAHTNDTGTEFGNFALIYTETLSLSLWLNAVVKHTVRRARPYTHHRAPAVRAWVAEHARSPWNSFYSGHASTAFSAFTSGGFLFANTDPGPEARRTYWAVQAAFAGAVAHLRVRAGMHYPSDVIVGALAGSAFGTLVPVWHGIDLELDGGDLGAIGAGLLVGSLSALLVPSDSPRERSSAESAYGIGGKVTGVSLAPTQGPGSGLSLVVVGTL